jgi:hypothetical protein
MTRFAGFFINVFDHYATCVRVLLDGVAWCQVDQDGLNATRGDVSIRPVKSGVCREDHVPKGIKRCMMVLGGEVEHSWSRYVRLGRTG